MVAHVARDDKNKVMKTMAKIVTFVPESQADLIRDVLGKTGAGKLGNYEFCSFSSKGTGRFQPTDGANPVRGSIGKLESVAEERIEVVCDPKILQDVLNAVKQAHPYEEVPIDVYEIHIA